MFAQSNLIHQPAGASGVNPASSAKSIGSLGNVDRGVSAREHPVEHRQNAGASRVKNWSALGPRQAGMPSASGNGAAMIVQTTFHHPALISLIIIIFKLLNR